MITMGFVCPCGYSAGLLLSRAPGACPECGRPAETEVVSVGGIHEASGIGEVTGLDVEGPAQIQPGTVVRASGEGIITGTKIRAAGKPKT